MILNLTPHNLTIYRENQIVLEVPSHGSIRLTEKIVEAEPVVNQNLMIPVVEKKFDGISIVLNQELETPLEAHIVVSLPVLLEIKKYRRLRDKLSKNLNYKGIIPLGYYAPDTGNGSVVRDEQGRIVGVRRLIKG